MGIRRITAAEFPAVDLQEFKDHLRVDGEDEDSGLNLKLYAAQEKLEGDTETARAFLTSTWDLYMDHWPCWTCGSCWCRCRGGSCSRHENADTILMPKGQLQSVASIIYTDSAGTPTTWPTTEYEVDTASEPGRIVLAYGKSWPSVTLKRSNAIVARFVAGWPDSDSMPFPLKAAVLLEAAHMYRNRESVTTGRMELQSMALARGVDDLIAPYRIRGVVTQ